MSREVRVGIVGTGFIAGKHLAALTGFPDVRVVAVADPDPARLRAMAERTGATSYGDGLELLARAELDAVWICVPPFAHGPLEEAAVARDLPFFVEKPLAADLATAQAVAEQVERRGLVTGVGYHWRYLSLVEEARERLAGRPVRLVQGCWLDATPPAPWWVDRARSGGQLLEQTTHLVDLARLLVGEVTRVEAVEAPAGDGLVPWASAVTLGFEGGAIGSITSARFLTGRHRVALGLYADGRAVELSERAIVDHELRCADEDGDHVRRSAEDPIAAEDRAFLDAVLGRGDDVRAPYAEALRTHALAWAADRSAHDAAARAGS